MKGAQFPTDGMVRTASAALSGNGGINEGGQGSARRGWLSPSAFDAGVRAALAAAALILASGIHAANLFLPVGPAGAADVAPVAKSAPKHRSGSVVSDAWERRVRITRDELTTARADIENSGIGRLLLNVRDGVHLDVVVERTAPTRWGYSLSGRVASPKVGFVTLVVHRTVVAGSIWTPSASYQLLPLGDGVNALRDATNASRGECVDVLPMEFGVAGAADVTAHQDGTANRSVVDILVPWTPGAAAWLDPTGDPQIVLSLIELFIAQVNDAFERSGAFVSLNLVGAEKVDYSETDIYTDFQRLVASDDGYVDAIHERRNALGADLIYFMIGHGNGVAQSLGSFSIGGPTAYLFMHEIGHNFGILHDRSEFRIGTRYYNHGSTTRGCDVSTIMSFGMMCVGRGIPFGLNFYASPWRYNAQGGRPLGVARFSKERGARGPADAVLTLNRNRHRVSGFRQSRRVSKG